MVEIKVPPLGESISEATIASIVKKVGSSVKTDELLIELETDKVTLEINAPPKAPPMSAPVLPSAYL